MPKSTKKLPAALIGPFPMLPRVSCSKVPSLVGIYRISCVPLGQHYIGQTSDTARRWLEHQEQLYAGSHGNPALQAAFNFYGHSGFEFSILEHLPGRWKEGTATLAEQRWLDAHRDLHPDRASLFNVRPAGTNHWLRTTKAGRKAVQDAARERLHRGQGNFHRRNRDHL